MRGWLRAPMLALIGCLIAAPPVLAEPVGHAALVREEGVATQSRSAALLAYDAWKRGERKAQDVVPLFEEVVRLDPDSVDDRLKLAELYEAAGRPDDARQAREIAGRLVDEGPPLADRAGFSLGAAQAAEQERQLDAQRARAADEVRRREALVQAERAAGGADEQGARPIQPAKIEARPRPPKPGDGIIGRLAPGPTPVSAGLPSFPWPPPTPSERLNLTRAQILPAASAKVSLADVGHHIAAALEAAGYFEYSFYAAPRGFAVVARLERIDPDGTPAPEKLRFLAPEAAEPFSLASYVSRLFFAPEGFYRQIVFVITTDVVRPSGRAPNAQAAEALLQAGADRLPAEFRRMPFTDDYQVSALIYEYQKGLGDRDVRTLTPGRLAARTNLERAGIYPRLVAAGKR